VVSDHGFRKYTKQVRPGAALAAAQMGDQAYIIPEGGTAYVYLKSPELATRVTETLQGVEGIDRIIGPDGFAALGLPQPAADPQMFQLLLTAKAGYSFSAATGGPVTAEVPQQAGSHGFLASDAEMDPIFIASGYGVRAGARLNKIDNIDVASTLAALLGVQLPTAKGRAIPLQ